MSHCILIVTAYIACFSVTSIQTWSENDKKVQLTGIQALTLYSGKYTTGRRSAPVPQIHCTGGSAGCKTFIPQVVQCYNRGSDGVDVQWECKTDMDNAYRFGQVDVICEGYDYSDDPYVLKGSCGLEYTLELTAEGMKKQGSQQYGASHDNYQSSYHNVKNSKSAISDLLFYAVVILFMYAIYKTCVRNQQYSPTGDDNDHPDDGRRTGFGYPRSGPPPPGFRPGFTPDDSCSTGSTRSSAGGSGLGGSGLGGSGLGGSGLGGFWTGAAAGSMLGYMFGNRNPGGGGSASYAPSSRGSSWGGSSGFSSGSRTTSGFGGTRRR